MSRAIRFALIVLLFSGITLYSTQKAHLESSIIDPNSIDIHLTIPLEPDQYIYYDLTQISVNSPRVTLSTWRSSIEPIIRYDSIFKEDKKIITQSPTLSFSLSRQSETQDPVDLRLVYYTNKSKTPIELVYPVSFEPETPTVDQASSCPITETVKKISKEEEQRQAAVPTKPTISWADYLKTTAQSSQLLWVRLLIAFLLGLMLSLTPCIYPMIPITVGILNAHGSRSLLRNFSLAVAYTMGVATTFALLGLAAALAGHAFGSFMNHPLVILVIVALLIYSAFSLFGWYEIRMPRWLQKSNAQGGSLVAAYLFGAVSGTVASPCLSPGLLFMLTLVATLKSVFLGFVLLFFFAIGLSMPLLVVGTFSSSLKLLPRAGAWMIEIKYLFGFMLLGMCFYFLAGIVPAFWLTILLSAFLLVPGVFYIHRARSVSGNWQRICNIFGMIMVGCSMYVGVKAAKDYYFAPVENKACLTWLFDFEKAQKIASNTRKPIFLFIHAPRCLSCVELAEKLAADNRFRAAMCNVVPIDCDLSKRDNKSTQMISGTYELYGAPSCLLLDCNTYQIVKRWDGELDDQQYEDLIATLELVHHPTT